MNDVPSERKPVTQDALWRLYVIFLPWDLANAALNALVCLIAWFVICTLLPKMTVVYCGALVVMCLLSAVYTYLMTSFINSTVFLKPGFTEYPFEDLPTKARGVLYAIINVAMVWVWLRILFMR